ncbi:MAG: aldo/keto reductase [Myxococcota bacterium]
MSRAALGLGCMRLSNADVGEERALAVLVAALQAGVTLLDTADVYAPDADHLGHNERLVATALQRWGGPRGTITVATKGGLIRTPERWLPDGRAAHLRHACKASATNLGTIDLYQLHAPDPARPLKTSVRTLHALKHEGLIRKVGLCNVSLTQLREAQEVTEIASVQVPLSLWDDDAIRSGVVGACLVQGIMVLAHTPLGGPRGAARCGNEPVLLEIARARGISAQLVALSYLADLSSWMVPLPGVTRVETAREAAALVMLTHEERARLDARFPTHASLREPHRARPVTSAAAGDVVMLMGIPGAGKSSLARELVARGYARLNRDEAGGSLKALVPKLRQALSEGRTHVVLDNTYGTRESRQRVIEAANELGVPARCIWLTTSLEDAQVNAVWRMLERYGRLLDAAGIKAVARKDPNAFLPRAQFNYRDNFERPSTDEGLASVEEVPFVRRWPEDFHGRAVLLEYDGILRRSRAGARTPISEDDVEILPGATEALTRWRDAGYALLGTCWLPEIEEGRLTTERVTSIFQRTHALLGHTLEVVWCPHRPGPPACWCRKPLPGMGVELIRRHRLDPAQCYVVGRSSADATFARRLGFRLAEGITPPE